MFDIMLHDLDYKFLGIRQYFDVKLIVRLRKTSHALFQAITFCNMAIGQNKIGQNRPKLHIRKFRYTMGIYKIKIVAYINIFPKENIWNTFFISTFLPYKLRFYKQRYYIRFFCGNNNIAITVFPNRYGDIICGQLYHLYTESELSPLHKKTKKDNQVLYRQIMTEF